MRVLIVDDEKSNLDLFTRIIKDRLGHQVTTASTVDEARQLLEGGQFDWVVTDYAIGDGKTGHDVARLAKHGNSHARVLLMSGLDRPLGEADAFLLKGAPTFFSDLANILG